MLRYLIKRILQSILTLFAISVLTFILFFAVPSSPAYVMCGKNCSPAQVAQTEERLGLREPKVTQYVKFIKGIFVGRDYGSGDFLKHCPAPCLGYSFRSQEPVTSIMKRTIPVTLSIVLGGAVIWLGVGVSLGVWAALRRGTVFDKSAMGLSLGFASMLTQFLGLVLLLIFVYSSKLLDYPRWASPFEHPLTWLSAMILPWITLGLINSAIYARLSRAQMLETLSEDYVRTARAKGLSSSKVHINHALRAAVTPLVTIAGLDLGGSLGGAVITETVFGLPGVGKTAINAVNDLNLPVVMATVLLAAFFIVVANVLVDVLYAVIDPRVRLS